MCSGVSLGTLEKRQLSCPAKNRNTIPRVMKPVAQSLHPLHRPNSYKMHMRILHLKRPTLRMHYNSY
jgi:hypothetical protein